MSMKVKEGDYVSADKDWRSLISNELNGAKQWEEDWGFLSSGNALINDTIDTKIQKLEEKLKQSQDSNFKTTSSIYGKGTNLEMYPVTENNFRKTKEIKPCDRKPKNSKK